MSHLSVTILAPLDPGGIVIDGGTKYRSPKGRVLRPEGPNIEARRAQCGGGYLGMRQLVSGPPPARDLGERCKLPQRGLGRSPAEIEFGAF